MEDAVASLATAPWALLGARGGGPEGGRGGERRRAPWSMATDLNVSWGGVERGGGLVPPHGRTKYKLSCDSTERVAVVVLTLRCFTTSSIIIRQHRPPST